MSDWTQAKSSAARHGGSYTNKKSPRPRSSSAASSHVDTPSIVSGIQEENGIGLGRRLLGRLLDLDLETVFGHQTTPIWNACVCERGIGLGRQADVQRQPGIAHSRLRIVDAPQ